MLSGVNTSQFYHPHFHSHLHSWIAAESAVGRNTGVVPGAHSWMQAAAGNQFSNRSMSNNSVSTMEDPSTSLSQSGWMNAASTPFVSNDHPSLNYNALTSIDEGMLHDVVPNSSHSHHQQLEYAQQQNASLSSISFLFPPTPPKGGTPENLTCVSTNIHKMDMQNPVSTVITGARATSFNISSGDRIGRTSNGILDPSEIKPLFSKLHAVVGKSKNSSAHAKDTLSTSREHSACTDDYSDGRYQFPLSRKVSSLNPADGCFFASTSSFLPTYQHPYMTSGDFVHHESTTKLGFHPTGSTICHKSPSSSHMMVNNRARNKNRSSTG